MYKYKLLISFAYATSEAPNFTDKKEELEKAITDFNKKFIGKKELKLGSEIREKSCELILTTYQPANYPTREISAFSQILKYDYKWKDYSRVETRMFDIKVLSNEQENIKLNINSNNSHEQVQTILKIDDLDKINSYINDLSFLLELAKAKRTIIKAKDLI